MNVICELFEDPKSSLEVISVRFELYRASNGSSDPDVAFKLNVYVTPAVSETRNRSRSSVVSIDPVVAAPPIVTTPVVEVVFE